MKPQVAKDVNAPTPLPKLEDVLLDLFVKIENRGQRGIETGFFELDYVLNGLQDGELILVAGRPSIGKTALAMGITEHAAVDLKLTCVFFTLEMSNEQFAQRLVCSRAGIDAHKLRLGMLESHQYAHLANGVGEVGKSSLFVKSLPAVELDDLCTLARIAVNERGAKLVVIDYVQLID